MKILITAGPTWVKIDDLRILTSIFTGRTGLFLAKEFKKRSHSVTLVINPHCIGDIRGLRVIPFRYFEDFRAAIIKVLKKEHFDAILHSAAVSDYKLKSAFRGKISSGKSRLNLALIPTEKIIATIRKLAKGSVLVQFKLEIERKGLLEKAYRSLKENKSDFVVANALEDLKLKFEAFLMDKNRTVIALHSRKALFSNLYKILRLS